jgi:hypothetical protein
MSGGKLNIEKTQRKLFLDTCKVLGLDPRNLSLAQRLRVDRASALRLEIDDLQAAQLGGRAIDIRRFIDASEALERLVNSTPTGNGSESSISLAHKRLAELIGNHASERDRSMEELKSENAKLRAEIAELRAPAPEPRPDNVVPIDGVARANAAKPPVHYLAESLHRHQPSLYGDGGVIVAPSWSPPGGRRA